MKPWEKQQRIKNSGEPLPQLQDIISIAESIGHERTRCMFVLLYLTGSRICELVRKTGYDLVPVIRDKANKKYRYQKIENPEKSMPSIKKKQITFEVKKGREVMLVFLRNEKNKRRKTKEIPIPLDREENIKLVEMVKSYISGLQEEEELFPFGYQYAYKLIKGYFNPHWFRHIRATHLTVKYDLPTSLLKSYMGWTDERQAGRYQELRWGDILDRL